MRALWRFAVLLTLPLSGCSTYSLQDLRQATPTGNAFQTALSKRYLDFATRQEKAYDWLNSMHFADKGLMAAYGKDVAPEELKNWDLPADVKPDLEQARAMLISRLTPEVEGQQPELAADAQLNFDCWVTYQEPNWQQDKIAQCREGLKEALARLGEPAAPAPLAEEAPEEPGPSTKKPVSAPKKPATEKSRQAVDAQSYMIFFELNHSDLTEEGKHTVDGIATKLAKESGYDIVLNGHTDAVGSQEYNLKLSNRRAETVKNRLIDDGVDEHNIKLFAFGKSDPLVKTGDGVAEPKNRRVEIFLNE